MQAQAFSEIAEKIGKPIETVIALEVPMEVLEKRITGRRVCSECGAIYHIEGHPTKVEGVCDVCGGAVVQRKDDTIEQLKVRMEEYENSTKPVIDYYGEKGLVHTIDASRNREIVFAEVQEALGEVA